MCYRGGGRAAQEAARTAFSCTPTYISTHPFPATIINPKQGPFALGEEEPLVVVSMFVPQNWALLHYQDYTLLARNFLQQLHMVRCVALWGMARALSVCLSVSVIT